MESEASIPETRGLLDQEPDADAPELAFRHADSALGFVPKETKFERISAIIGDPTFRVTACAFMIYFLSEFGLNTLQVPGSRLFEHAVCRKHYRNAPNLGIRFTISKEIDESLCKIAPIQREVALLTGWRDSFMAVPSILTAVIYGTLADKYGRKPILVLAGIGEMMVLAWILFICYFDEIFPTRLSWASSLFIFIGGGQRVLVAMLFTMISDQVDISHRTRYMFIMNTGPHASGLITPPIEALTMSVNVWFPFFVGIGAYLLMYLVIFVMPDGKTIPKVTEEEESVSLETERITQGDLEPRFGITTTRKIVDLFKTPNLVICFTLFLLKRTGFMSEILFYQYASATFNLKLRQTPWFRSVKAVESILVLSLILPIITTVFQRLRHNSRVIDLNIIRGSCFTMVVSFLSIYTASSPGFFAFAVLLCGLGEGIDPGIQGLSSTFVNSDHRATMFTTLAMIDAAGKIMGGPLMAALYSFKMDAQGRSAGFCFLFTSILFGIGCLISFGINLDERPAQT